ncbi:MAG: 50S ribosomal protein L24 [Xylanivirga thermophila]|jgi:large subunit ribosomal protein L24|uniref:50S ribosomal protein L24 n=1 Tax=Xylanivirga thermophila TaxID=2496273 RepID=UPI00101D4060|nr:50S ribosomal protein L24 [Xylanivirga thermophila]
MAENRQKMQIKKGDTVEVISGKDKAKKGKVLSVLPKEGKVIVEGVNILTKHQKARGIDQPGGIIHQEGPIYASKVMVVCNKCNKKTRIAKKILEDGSRVRVCKQCGEIFND